MIRQRHTLMIYGFALAALPALTAAAQDYEKFQAQAKAEAKKTIDHLTSAHSEALVTLKFVVKENMFGQERKNEMEAPAVMIAPDGMVLAASSRLQGLMTMGLRMMGGMAQQFGGLPTPQSDLENVRVLIGNDPAEFEAKLVVRDSDLDLAWVRITDPKGRTFKHVDLGTAAELEVGDSYYIISRMAERFDRVPIVQKSSVLARIENPRTLLVGGSGGTTLFGLPVFSAKGQIAGFLITQAPEEGEAGAMSLDSMAMASSFILPAAKLAKATQRAQELDKQ